MGKKYIIELEEAKYVNGSSYKDDILWRVKGFKSLVFDQKGLDKLTSFESLTKEMLDKEIEQRKKEYNRGFEEGKKYVIDNYGWAFVPKLNRMDYDSGYKDGIAVSEFIIKLIPKLWGFNNKILDKLFGTHALIDICKNIDINKATKAYRDLVSMYDSIIDELLKEIKNESE